MHVMRRGSRRPPPPPLEGKGGVPSRDVALFSPLRKWAGGLALAVALGACAPASADEAPRLLPAPTADMPAAATQTERAVLAGGCFWGVEGVFERVRGVTSVRSGYSGGRRDDATYAAVSAGRTDHAEAVEIVYDPRVISYGQILRIFFSVATDPTQLNRQGPDVGRQYRSNIFAVNAEQARVARAYIAELNAANAFSRPIVTRVDAFTRFYPAESYHQDFLRRNPRHPYIVRHDLPKIAALQRFFPQTYSSIPAA
jgi:peptide-methionine (S)-S-oxide reductase